MFGITQEMVMTFIIRMMVLFTAMPVHEYAHGFVADLLGDDTPRKQGRLTLDPLAHLDRAGSILLFFTGFGWGRPVEVDTRNFKHPRRDMALSSLAGPLSNILMALLGFAAYRVLLGVMPMMRTNVPIQSVATILNEIVWINVCLAVFNLLPMPPLDGSKVIGLLLPRKLYWNMLRYQYQISIVLMLLLVFHILDAPIFYLSIRLSYFLDNITAPVSALFG